MSTQPPFRKVFDGVATRAQMFTLFNRHSDTADGDPLSGKPYSGEWFEIEPSSYHFMLGLLPPLFQRTGMFGMSEYKAGNVTSVFFAIRIRGRERWFHGFCDLSDKRSPDAMRAAIVARETSAIDSMTRGEKLEAIWSGTPAEYRGIAGNANPDAWPPEHQGKRTILIYVAGQGTTLKLLEDHTDEKIDSRMPAVGARSRRGGATMRSHRKQAPADKPTWEAHSIYTAELGVPDRRRYRHTALGAPTVADLVNPGDTVSTSYSTGGVVLEVKECFYAAPTGETLSHFTIVYVPPNRAAEYRDSDRHWINECVAVDGRILMLFEANSNEVFIALRADPVATRQSRSILIS